MEGNYFVWNAAKDMGRAVGLHGQLCLLEPDEETGAGKSKENVI